MTVALHQGVIANQQITRLAGASHEWNEAQQCFHPTRDAWLATHIEGIWIAGGGGGIDGGVTAGHDGRIAACGIAYRLGCDPSEVPLSLATTEIWYGIADLVDDDCGIRPTPQIKVAESEAHPSALCARATLMQKLGHRHEQVISENQLRELQPAAAPHCLGGLASFGDGYGDPCRATFAFKRKSESLGVRFFEVTRVIDIERTGADWRLVSSRGALEAGTEVNCAGAWAAALCGILDEPVSLEPIAPMMIVSARLPSSRDPVVGAKGRPRRSI